MHDWLTGGSRVKAIVGHFGSGKTEIALNAAVYLREKERRVKLIDLDIVNPFFRSAEQKELLRKLEDSLDGKSTPKGKKFFETLKDFFD